MLRPGVYMNKQALKNSSLFLFFYRYIKVALFRLLYSTFIYKLIFKNACNIEKAFDPSQKYKLVVCHNGGGGTVSYMHDKYDNQAHILFLRNTVSADIDYIYSIENSDTGLRTYIKPKEIRALTDNISEIHVIAVESYMNLKFILGWFSSLAAKGAPLTYDIHDFHCVWYETHFIHKGKYLTRPQLEKSILNYAGRKITFSQWHDTWADFFPYVQKINAFSQSSKKIFGDYYPDFVDKVIVTPHSLDYIKCGKLKKLPEKFTVGIFGIIRDADKGCNVVRSFLDFSKGRDYEVYVNGELAPQCSVTADNIHYMGLYDVGRLDKVIEEQGITCVLFPSTCPETFSYTVSELIHVGVPLASFNLGAQAEKVMDYKYGQIIESDDFENPSNEAILEALKKAFEKGRKDERE